MQIPKSENNNFKNFKNEIKDSEDKFAAQVKEHFAAQGKGNFRKSGTKIIETSTKTEDPRGLLFLYLPENEFKSREKFF